MPRFPLKVFWLILFVPVVIGTMLFAADTRTVTFYVQLICGSDSDKPLNPDWKPVGPKLNQRLRAVFRWKHYWEVKRESVELNQNHVARLHLTRERDVEVTSYAPPATRIRLYYNGQLTRCQHQPIGEHMCLLGGDAESGDSWFVTVRRDQPVDP